MRAVELAARRNTTRSAAGVELYADRLPGAVLAIGNAPTALFRLLELIDEGAPAPGCVLGGPVGFVGFERPTSGRMTVMGKDPVGDDKGVVIAQHDLLDEAGRLVFSCLSRSVFRR